MCLYGYGHLISSPVLPFPPNSRELAMEKQPGLQPSLALALIMSSQLVPLLAQFLRTVHSSLQGPFQPPSASPFSVRGLWTAGISLYRANRAEVKKLERELSSGFDVSWTALVSNVYICLVKSVLRCIKDAGSEDKAARWLLKKRLIWDWFSDQKELDSLLNARSIAPAQRYLYLAYLLALLHSPAFPALHHTYPFRSLIFPDSTSVVGNSDLLEELRLTLPGVTASYTLYKACKHTYEQANSFLPNFPSRDEFVSFCSDCIDGLVVFPLEQVGLTGWAVSRSLVLVDLFEDVADEVKVGFALIEFLHQVLKLIIGRTKASLADCLADDFGQNPAYFTQCSKEMPLIPASDHSIASNFDLIIPHYSLDKLAWRQVWKLLDSCLFGAPVKSLNYACVQFLTQVENWEILSSRTFQLKFRRYCRQPASCANPTEYFSRRRRRRWAEMASD